MLQITKERDGDEIEVKPGECIQIELPENPTTGYRWQVHPPSNLLLELQGDTFESAGQASCGAGGTRQLRYCARSEGTTKIEMEYGRSWEKGPVDMFHLTVRVKK